MGLREDFRSALGAIAAAAPEATATMRHGEESGAIVQASSRDFAGSVSDAAPDEAARYVANAADFPTLEVGSAVEISVADTSRMSSPSFRAVVSMKEDAVGATITIGLSAEFDKCPASYSGTRRIAGAVRTLRHSIDVLLLEGGTADNYTDALAPTYATAYTVAIRRADWPEESDPEVSDTIEAAPDYGAIVLKVSTVTRHGGWYILKCRTRG